MDLCWNYIGPINDSSISQLVSDLNSKKRDITSLTLQISSSGGSLNAGITAYNLLKAMPFPITTHNIGDTSSAAILLYLAGSKRIAENASKFMIHPVMMTINEELSLFKAAEMLHTLEADIKNYGAIVNQETDQLKGKYDVTHYLKTESLILDKQSALECGIVTTL